MSIDAQLEGQFVPHLTRSDAPVVARAMVDVICGRAKVVVRNFRGLQYLRFIRTGVYKVSVREDDWRKILPFLRHSTPSYSPVNPPLNKPGRVPSPQPNRTMETSPESPSPGLRSFLEGFPFDLYQKLQWELTTNPMAGRFNPSFKSLGPAPEPVYLDFDQESYRSDPIEEDLLNRLTSLLSKLFPIDFPTTNY